MARFPRPSPTTESLSAGVFSALAERARAHPGPIYPLHVGDTWREPWEGARCENLRTADFPLLHAYAPVQGEPALLDVIERRLAARSGQPVDRQALCVVSGATSGLSVVAQAILDPGDEVLLPAPFWPLIRGIIASRGAVPVQVPLWDRRREPGFDVEAALEAAVTPRTVALYVNSPHNPTGGILRPEEVDAFARVAERHDLWLLADEVYEELYYGDEYGDEAPSPIWAREDLRRRAIAVHSLSKAYGYAGGRVGFAHGPREVMQAIRAVQTFQVYCAPRPMQIGAARMLAEGDGWLRETRALYRAAAEATARAFGVEAPAGGTFLFVDASPWLPPGAEDVTPFLLRCLEEAGVLLTPGGASGDAYRKWARVCFTSVAPEVLAEGLGKLARVLGRG